MFFWGYYTVLKRNWFREQSKNWNIFMEICSICVKDLQKYCVFNYCGVFLARLLANSVRSFTAEFFKNFTRTLNRSRTNLNTPLYRLVVCMGKNDQNLWSKNYEKFHINPYTPPPKKKRVDIWMILRMYTNSVRAKISN